ncbi:MAG: hypothetical protein JSR63_07845 [Proteobacteria bacterium]|nr:hypothetical protein [Pseudomonadota bacterium]
MIRHLFLTGAVLMLASCSRENVKSVAPPPVVSLPETVTRVVREYVQPPAELTADCYDEPAKEQTNAEALRLALLRKESLAECTARMRKIRGLAPKAVKP